MSDAVTDLRASSCAILPPVIAQCCTASCNFRVLSTISHCPVSVDELTVGDGNIVRASAIVLCIHVAVVGGIDPDKLTNLISVAVQLAGKCTMVDPDLTGRPDVYQDTVFYILSKEVDIADYNIIAGFIAGRTIFVICTEVAVLKCIGRIRTDNGLVITDSGMPIALHIKITIYNDRQRLCLIELCDKVILCCDNNRCTQQTTDGASLFSFGDGRICSKAFQTIQIQLILLIGRTAVGAGCEVVSVRQEGQGLTGGVVCNFVVQIVAVKVLLNAFDLPALSGSVCIGCNGNGAAAIACDHITGCSVYDFINTCTDVVQRPLFVVNAVCRPGIQLRAGGCSGDVYITVCIADADTEFLYRIGSSCLSGFSCCPAYRRQRCKHCNCGH